MRVVDFDNDVHGKIHLLPVAWPTHPPIAAKGYVTDSVDGNDYRTIWIGDATGIFIYVIHNAETKGRFYLNMEMPYGIVHLVIYELTEHLSSDNIKQLGFNGNGGLKEPEPEEEEEETSSELEEDDE